MTRPAEEEAVLNVAERIADGSPVDWDDEARRHPHSRPRLESLRTVERIAEAQRILTSRALDPAVTTAGTTVVVPPLEAADSAGRTWGTLTIRAKLGQGAFGEVYRAYDPALDREVALKLVELTHGPNELDAKRFLGEARRLARVRHSNVLVVHGAEIHAGRAGIWTDLLRGRTLQQYLEQEGTIGPQEAALIGMELCRALAAVHRVGLVHRDLKPANVMREEGGRIILMDFGAGAEAKPREEGGLASTIEGTPIFMAPEQLRGEAVTPAVDLYALGVLLYFAVSGTYPIEASHYEELVRKHRSGAAVPLRDRRPDLPVEFVQVVERALDPDPRRRFASAGAFERALSGTLGPGAQSVEAAREVRSGGWRITGRALGVALAGGLATVVAVVLLVRWSQISNIATPQPPRPSASGDHTTSGGAPPAGAARKEALLAKAVLYRGDGAKREPIEEGARVAPGDAISLAIESGESMYVYVLNEDSNGSVYVLFPVAGLYPVNPLPPGVAHRLPGQFGAQPVNWEITTAGGRERILVLAGRAPLAALEREILRFPHAAPGAPIRYGQLSESTVGTLRSIGGMAPSSDPVPARSSRLSELLGKLDSAGAPADRPWVYQISLDNSPAR